MDYTNMLQSEKRGLLTEDLKVFHLQDQIVKDFEYHYHEFNKIIIFMRGNVTYMIEGKAYKLRPWDILVINHSQIHKPIIDPSEEYERFIIWFDPNKIALHNREDVNLLSCFELAASWEVNLLRLSVEPLKKVRFIVDQFMEAEKEREFGHEILKNALLIQLLIILNRSSIKSERAPHIKDIQFNKNITSVLSYINHNLENDLSIPTLAAKFYMSKYHLMRKFKAQTGYTIHQYILQKRLLLAKSMLTERSSITEICQNAGFNDYSSFVRAFKKEFGLSPREYLKVRR